jgi:hypothetical protein
VRVDTRNTTPLEVKRAFQFLHSEDKRTKLDGDNYIPSNQLYIKSPDGEKVMFKKASHFTRSELMVMEMLSTNQWKRPMYFAVTIGNDYHLGLDPYLELTGMAYRITPERSEDGRPRVNTAEMYENMMHQFRFGNVNQPGIYLDENTLRMCRTHRMMFAQLAEALYMEGWQTEDTLVRKEKHAKALQVLDYADEMLPACNVSYDHTSVSMAALYYELDQPEKANTIMQAMADNAIEYIQWGASLDSQRRSSAQSTINNYIAIFDYVMRNFMRFEQKELFNQYFDVYKSLGLNE